MAPERRGMYFDAHNHFHDRRLDALDRAAVVAELKERGLRRMVVNGTAPEDWEGVAACARHFGDFVIPSYGVHPWRVHALPEGWENMLRARLDAEPGPVGIGEVGLDRWIEQPDMERQQAVFAVQLALAAESDRPLTIHCLRAWGLLLEVLREVGRPARGFLVHSPGASPEVIGQLAELGAYFSISGYFADPRRKKYRRALEAVPDDRLLIETDAPDMLPPEHYREASLREPETGHAVTHPADLFAVYRFVGESKGWTPLDVRRRVGDNFERFFLA